MAERTKVSLVLYEGQERPRYYELSPGLVKALLYGLPLLTFLAVIVTAGLILYFKEIRAVAIRKEPAIIQKLTQERETLAARETELIRTAQELELKLATTEIDTEGLSATLGLFKYVPGMEDLSATPSLSIEDIQLRRREGQANLTFNLVNLTPDTSRQAGYIFALFIAGPTVSVYPEGAFTEDDPLIAFNRGEYFATARFRPVEASFTIPPNTNRGIVKILLFSRTGDLLAKQTQNVAF
jgi:hypothetical protein